MLRFFRAVSLSTKTSIMALMGYLFFGGALLLVTQTTMGDYLMQQAQKQVNINAGLARALLEKTYGKEFRLDGAQLYIGQTAINGQNEAIDRFTELMGGGVMTVFMGDTRVATNVINPETKARAVGTKLARNAAFESVFDKKSIYFGEAAILGEDYLTAYDPILNASGEVIGIIFVGIKKAARLQLIGTMIEHIAVMTLLLGLFMSVVTYIAIKFQLAPLGALQRVMARLEKEETDFDVPALNRGDEIGRMALAIQRFREAVIEKIAMRREQAEAKQRAEDERKTAMHALADNFEKSVKQVVSAVSAAASETKNNAQKLSGVAAQTQGVSTTVAQAAAQASDNIQSVVTAAEELNASVADINHQIEQSTRVAASCVAEAEATGAVVQTLSEAAGDIDNVVKLIEGIAHQVNLLALNATIEAARAGETGKGFAVVAGEVKNLANQASSATKNITDQIANIQQQTQKAVETIAGITQTIRQVNDISRSIADAVAKQSTATTAISRSIMNTAEEAQTVTNSIGSVTQGAREAGQASQNVLETADTLTQQSQMLAQAVDTLIAHIRQS